MRNYIVASWSDADQYDYSGEQIGNRLSKSQRVHFNPDGSACVASYGDDEPKVSKVSIKDKILPQLRRLNTLRAQMVDLEVEYKTTNMTCVEYSMLRDVLFAKVQRQEVLLKRAQSIKPTQPDEDDIDLYCELPDDSALVQGVYYATNHVSPTIHTSTWVDNLPASNSLKLPMQKTVQLVRMLVKWHQRTRNYIKTLSEV